MTIEELVEGLPYRCSDKEFSNFIIKWNEDAKNDPLMKKALRIFAKKMDYDINNKPYYDQNYLMQIYAEVVKREAEKETTEA